jgi:hypothetical protein
MKHLYFCTITFVFLATGCGKEATQTGARDSLITMESAPPATVDVHLHATEGPHHGTLIELGNEEYHAELVHDEQSVTIYILDGSATKTIPIETTEVTINLVHDGKPAQYKLAASPDAGDPPGLSSRFQIQNTDLVQEIEHDHAGAKLSVLIGKKAYRGEIQHDHGEHDHDHDH